MSDLSALLARVEGATGPDREIDMDLEKVIDPDIAAATPLIAKYAALHAPAYTSSVDAVLALIERRRPGLGWRAEDRPWHTQRRPSRRQPRCWATAGPQGEQEEAWAATVPLALIAALLKAELSRLPEAGRRALSDTDGK